MDVKIVVALIGLVGLVLSNIGMWIREYLKHRTWRTNNGDVGEIKQTVKTIDEKTDCIDKKLAIVNTKVGGMKSHCKSTVLRFEKGLEMHSQQILDIAKNNRRDKRG